MGVGWRSSFWIFASTARLPNRLKPRNGRRRRGGAARDCPTGRRCSRRRWPCTMSWPAFCHSGASPRKVSRVPYALASLEKRARRSGSRFALIAFRNPSRSSRFRRTRQALPCPPPGSLRTATQLSRQRAWFIQISWWSVMSGVKLDRRLPPTRPTCRRLPQGMTPTPDSRSRYRTRSQRHLNRSPRATARSWCSMTRRSSPGGASARRPWASPRW